MFDKETLDRLWADLQTRYRNDPDWDQILQDTHVGVARSDAGVSLGDIDPRAIAVIEKHSS